MKQCLIWLICVFLLTGCFENTQSPLRIKGEPVYVKLSKVFSGFEQPVALLPAPEDFDVWYVVEKPGRIIRLSKEEPGADYNKTVYLDITDRVNASYNESGLLGMAFDPAFNENGYIYVSYTGTGKSFNLVSTISRFSTDSVSADPEREQILLQLKQPYSNHNGGQIGFTPDGYLMLGFGDGGSGGDPKGHGQNTGTLLGSLLRIDVRETVGKKAPYAIPKDNPFANSKVARPEIYAWGLRNPWRWSFDKKTGDLWLADVGQNHWEEINRITKGGNYGWNIREGKHCYKEENCASPAYIDPVWEYSHQFGCSVTGGYVYRGEEIASLQGWYIFGDFCSGRIWALNHNENSQSQAALLVASELNISSFAEDKSGELYVIHYNGDIYKIEAK